MGLAAGALALTLVMTGFYIADTTSGDTNLRNVLATLGFCKKLDTEPFPTAVNQPATQNQSGDAGQDGAEGSAGEDGASGQDGTSGAAGEDGEAGTDGVDGTTGTAGATGSTGSAGQPGSTGAPGATGATGEKGDTGATGATGAQGPAGPCTYLLDLALIDGNLIPSADNYYTLGNEDFRWKDLQLGPGTLYIEDAVTGVQAGITVSGGALLLDGADSLRIGNIRLTAGGIESILSDQDITIGNIGDTGYVVLARGLKFPDGTLQTTAGGGGAVGPEGPAGPQGPKGDTGSIGSYVEQAACVEGKNGEMIGPIEFGTCLENKKDGTDIIVLMKLP